MKLTQATSVTAGDWFAIYKTNEGDFYGVSTAVVLAWIQANLTFPSAGRPEPTTQYAAPAATAFNVQITDADDDIHLILTPLAGYADGTITLPLSTNLRDKQIVIVNCTQAVTTLVVDGNGATVAGAPVAFAANDYFTLKYDIAVNSWYRIG